MAKVLVLHGPNLNMLGEREPAVYGDTTLSSINSHLVSFAREAGHTLECLQSNAEDELIAAAQGARGAGVDFILINPAAFTHTSVALRDAITASTLPFIEVHLSNVYARESFRHHSYFSDIAEAVISGCGAQGYELALQRALTLLSHTKSDN